MNHFQLRALDSLLDQAAGASAFSGVVLIKHGDETVFARAAGYANRQWRIPNQLRTRFRLASVGKVFTAVACLQLIEQGRLALDTRAVQFLGITNTQIPDSVTVYHLLTMTSGIADWLDEVSDNAGAAWEALRATHPLYLLRDNADYLPLFANLPPLAPPGGPHTYSNAGYILLALMIERASGVRYFDYVRQNVFARAGMAASDFVDADAIQDDVAEGYIRDGESGWKRNIYHITAGAAGDGGCTSSAEDLCRFLRALRDRQLLGEALTRDMLTPKVLAEDDPAQGLTWQYSYGLFHVLDRDGNVVRYGLPGEEEGISCRLYHYPRHQLDVAVLANQGACAGKLALDIQNVITGPTAS